MKNDYWLGIDLDECKKLLETKSIKEVATHFGVSKWMMYKYTSYYHIDVWNCKKKAKDLIDQNIVKITYVNKDVSHIDQLTKESLEELILSGNSVADIAIKFNLSICAVQKRASRWKVSLSQPKKTKEVVKLKCKRCGHLFTKLRENGYCHNCINVVNRPKIENTATTDLGRSIIDLYNDGKSFKEIEKILGCSKSMVYYYCNPEGKEKGLEKCRRYRENWQTKFMERVYGFKTQYKYRVHRKVNMCKDWNKKFRSSVSQFRLTNNNNNYMEYNYSYKEVLEYLGGGTVFKCYLTGQEIDITKDNFELDHKIPSSKGGSNELDNLGITTREANRAKSDLTISEFLDLCEKVLKHHNYTVIKPE